MQAEEGEGGVPRWCSGDKIFNDKSQPGPLAGESLVRLIYYFLCLACFDHIGWLSRGSGTPWRVRTSDFVPAT